MPIRSTPNGAPPIKPSSTTATPATATPTPAKGPAAADPARPFAPPQGKVVVKDSTGMDPPVATVRPGALGAPAPAAPLAPTTGAGGTNATVAIAFDAIKAPGGPTESRLLSDGLDAWNARMEMIDGAKTTIDADYFILEKDPYGFAFLGALLKKQLEGVPVRVMTDAMADTFGKNGFKMPRRGKDYLQELVNHGAEAYIYHPICAAPVRRVPRRLRRARVEPRQDPGRRRAAGHHRRAQHRASTTSPARRT